MAKAGHASITTKVCPSNAAKIEIDCGLIYAYDKIKNSTDNRLFLELDLPDNFFTEGTAVPNQAKLNTKKTLADAPVELFAESPPVLITAKLPSPPSVLQIAPPKPSNGNGSHTSIMTGASGVSKEPGKVNADPCAVDTVMLCKYITLEMGDKAKVRSARSIEYESRDGGSRIIGCDEALDMVNRIRTSKQQRPFYFKSV